MILLDSSYLLALVDPSDGHHARAMELSRELRGPSAVSDLILSEVLTLVKQRCGTARARQVAEHLASSTELELVFLDASLVSDSVPLFSKFEKLSFCDAASAAFIRRFHDSRIVSFDADFDRVPGIKRLH